MLSSHRLILTGGDGARADQPEERLRAGRRDAGLGGDLQRAGEKPVDLERLARLEVLQHRGLEPAKDSRHVDARLGLDVGVDADRAADRQNLAHDGDHVGLDLAVLDQAVGGADRQARRGSRSMGLRPMLGLRSPGSGNEAARWITQPTMRSVGMARARLPAGSSVSSLSFPPPKGRRSKNHHGTPFIAVMIEVPAPTNGAIRSATPQRPWAFTATTT